MSTLKTRNSRHTCKRGIGTGIDLFCVIFIFRNKFKLHGSYIVEKPDFRRPVYKHVLGTHFINKERKLYTQLLIQKYITIRYVAFFVHMSGWVANMNTFRMDFTLFYLRRDAEE